MNISAKKDRYIFVCVLVICMIAGTLACMSKSGMHEDEFYSFYSSNRTNGFYAEGTVTTDVMLDELKVLPGSGFNFSLVKEVQSWDVHPPVYYFVLHFVCSLTSGIFSGWQGLAINLVCLAISIILMKRLGTIILPDNPLLVDLTILTWGLSPALLSGVVFIRMYMLLTVWILAVTLLHVSYLPCSASGGSSTRFSGSLSSSGSIDSSGDVSGSGSIGSSDSMSGSSPVSASTSPAVSLSPKFWIFLWIFTFLGFMTHYYFLIWLVFLGGAWNVILILDSIRLRKLRNTSSCAASAPYPASEKPHHNLHPASFDGNRRLIHPTIIYVIVELSCAAVCYLFYPAFPAQMFKGQRGAQATGNFFDLSNTWDRLCFFASKINRLGFGGGLWILLGLILIICMLIQMKTDVRIRYQTGYMAPSGLFDPRRKWENKKILPPDDITGTYGLIKDNNSEYTSSLTICLVTALIGYFLVISKTALILGDSSIRYHMPVLGIGYLVIALMLKKVSLLQRFLPALLIAFILIMNIAGDFTGRICFLYPENKEHLQTLSDHRNADVYYVYPDGQSWVMWAEGTQLLTFDKVTYLSVSEIYELYLATDTNGDSRDPNLMSYDGQTTVSGHSDPDGLQDMAGHEMIIYTASEKNTDDILKILGQYISRTDPAPARLLFSDDYTQTYLIENPD